MTTQIAIKLPDQVLTEVDHLIAAGEFSNRSQVVRRAVEALLEDTKRRRIDAAFADGFARVPEDDAELREATRLAVEAIEEEPWEPWW